MRIRLLVSLLLILFAVPVLSTQPVLGLRTIVQATPTEIEIATPTEEISPPGGPLVLKTLDPLLLSFREGWKVPELPGWKTKTTGTFDLKVPSGFAATVEMSGKNMDIEITDTDGDRFARLYIYQLQTYDVDELMDQLLGQLFGNRYSGDKEFQEFKDLGNGRMAYLSRVIIQEKKTSYPVVFVYNWGTEDSVIKAGETAMMIFEPDKYVMEIDRANGWIEGIAASYINGIVTVEKKEDVQKQVTEEVKTPGTGDPFVDFVVKVLDDAASIIDPPYDWEYVYGELIELYIPPEFIAEVDYFEDDEMEVVDLDFDGIVAKVIVGYSDDRDTFKGYLDWIIDAYLPENEKYTTGAEETRGPIGEYGGYVKIKRLDTGDSYYWILIYSDSEDPGIVTDEYMVFIGWADRSEPEYWADFYNTIVFSIEF